MTETTTVAIQWGVVIGASLVAAVTDIRTRRIPNVLSGTLFLAGLLWSLDNNGLKGLPGTLAAAVILSLPFVFLFLFAGGGAGDAKLTGAIGAWLSVNESFTALVCICLAGGALGLIVAVREKKLKIVLTNLIFLILDLVRAGIIRKEKIIKSGETAQAQQGEKLTMPYGVAICAGLCAAGAIIWLR